MRQPVIALLSGDLRSWAGTRGLWMAFGAALVPLLLVGTWVATHQDDVSIAGISADRLNVRDGDTMHITAIVANPGKNAVGPFNASIQVLTWNIQVAVGLVPVGGFLVPQYEVRSSLADARVVAEAKHEIPGLDPGETVELALDWNVSRQQFFPDQILPGEGVFVVLAEADVDDELSELDERDNLRLLGSSARAVEPVIADFVLPSEAEAPVASANLSGNASASRAVDAFVELSLSPSTLPIGETMRALAVVSNRGPDLLENATVSVRFGTSNPSSRFLTPYNTTTEQVTLAPGARRVVNVTWTPDRLGAYWAQVTVDPGQGASETEASDNVASAPFTTKPVAPSDLVRQVNNHPRIKPILEARERETIKAFYSSVFQGVHLHVILPLIALFYAAGVVSDARESGNLPYLLSRPVRRWLLPAAKFASGYAVSAAAVVAGILAAFGLLFGAPGGDVGFLTTPLLLSLSALFAYGALFLFLGTFLDRPYLVGVAFVIGWESIVGSLVPWAANLTLRHQVLRAFCISDPQAAANCAQGWSLDRGVQLLPQGGDSVLALVVLLVAGVTFLLAAGIVMVRREFSD